MLHLVLAAAILVQTPETSALRLRFVTSVAQHGPVGYRDPLGVISPDGMWLASASETRLRVQPVVGGPITELGAGDERITDLAWLPDGRHLAVRQQVFESGRTRWWIYDRTTRTPVPLWPDHTRIRGLREDDSSRVEVDPADLVQLTWSPTGDSVAGIARDPHGSALWVIHAGGGGARVRVRPWRLSFPAWRATSGIACLSFRDDRQRLDLECGVAGAETIEAYGPVAFSADARHLYYAVPNDRGTLDLWRRSLFDGTQEQETRFARDAYAPSVTRDGRVLFKVQDYRVFVAAAPADGGASQALTTFQSETPTWSPDGRSIGVTFGSWRRVIDDFHYPDIAQDLGIVVVQDTAVTEPTTVFRATPSEDQGMAWSPNGRWIAFHSHAAGTDDLYLQAADRSSAARLVSEHLYETGWPRWTPDGRWIVIPSEDETSRGRSGFLSVVGVDPETGRITSPLRRVSLGGLTAGALHAEWAGNDTIVFDAITALGRKELYAVSRGGGRPRLIHRYESDEVYAGIATSPDGRWVTYVAPAGDGHYQLFRVPVAGGAPRQLTFDPTDKTQPAYSPDGRRLAFTVFTYTAQFWLLGP